MLLIQFRLFNIFLLFSILFSVTIDHDPVNISFERESISLEIYVDNLDREILEALLMYKIESQKTFIETSMNKLAGNRFDANIPAYFNLGENIQYFFVITFVDGGILSYPSNSPYEFPIEIKVKTQKNNGNFYIKSEKKPGEILELKSDALVISPLENSTTLSDQFSIVVSFFNTNDIDMSTVEVFLDEININQYIKRKISYITCDYPFLKAGRHRLRIEMENTLGQSFESISWDFNIIDPVKSNLFSKFMNHSGKIWTSYSNLNFESYSNVINEFNLRYYADLDWLKIRVSGLSTSLEDLYEQTRNRFSINFSNNYVNLSFGDFYPQVNKFSLYGNRVRGIRANIDHKNIKLDFINGEILHEIQGNIYDDSMIISEFQSPNDLTSGYINLSRDNYTFSRDLSAVKFSLGIPKRFNINFDIVKVKDNILSVYNYLPGSYIKIPNNVLESIINPSANYLFQIDHENYILYEDLRSNLDNIFGTNYQLNLKETNWNGDKPKDNIILGSDILFNFDKDRVMIKTGFTFSLLNQNIWESITNISQLDTLGGDTTLDGRFMDLYDINDDYLKYDKIFELGINQVPLIPVNISEDVSALSKIFNLPSVIYNFETKLKYAGHSIQYKFLQVGPEFNSLANRFIQTNIREKSISDRLRLLGNRMIINTRWMSRETGIDVNDKNTITTTRYDSNLGFYPGLTLPSFRIGFMSIHRKSEKNRIDRVIVTSLDESEYDTIITDNRIETLQKQINLVFSNSFELFGLQQMSLNIFKSQKEDLLFEKKFFINPNYYSPSSNTLNTSLSVNSKFSQNWESNIIISLSEYTNGIAALINPEYFQEQDIQLLSFKIIRNNMSYCRRLSTNFSYTIGNGATIFEDLGFSFSGSHIFYNLVNIDWNYSSNRKIIKDSNKSKNSSFKVKLIYTI